MTDHLKEAKEIIEIAAQMADDYPETAAAYAHIAGAHAHIALVERLTFDGPQRLVSYDWSKARVDREDYAHAMDEVAESIGARVRACPYCQGEECSH